jgi:polysaccharide pyruvyl transferase WcaK-like protein
VAVITKLSNFNAGNEALSVCLLDLLGRNVPQAELRAIDRTWPLSRAMGAYTVAGLGREPEAALRRFDAMVEDAICRFGAEAAGELAPVAGPASVARPPQPSRRPAFASKLAGALRLRSRLAAAGLAGGGEARRALRTLAWADTLIWNAAGEIYPTRDWDDVLRLLILFAAAARLGARTVVVNHSIETIDPVLDALLAHVYARASLVYVRGRHSREKALALGVSEGKLIEAPDLAFLLGGGAAAPASPGPIPAGAIVLALNGRLANRGDPEWDSLFAGLAALGRPIVFMSNSIADDASLAARWRGAPGLTIIERQPGFRELLAMLAPAGLVVSSRFHSAIFAFCSGVPVVAMEPGHHRVREMLEQLDYPLGAERLDRPGWSARTLEQVGIALADRPALSRRIEMGLGAQRTRVAAAYAPLFDLLVSSP